MPWLIWRLFSKWSKSHFMSILHLWFRTSDIIIAQSEPPWILRISLALAISLSLLFNRREQPLMIQFFLQFVLLDVIIMLLLVLWGLMFFVWLKIAVAQFVSKDLVDVLFGNGRFGRLWKYCDRLGIVVCMWIWVLLMSFNWTLGIGFIKILRLSFGFRLLKLSQLFIYLIFQLS